VYVIRIEQHRNNTQPTVSDPEFACPGEMIESKTLGVNSFAGTACIVLGPNHLLITLIILANLLLALF
jgi:hypothetical protein